MLSKISWTQVKIIIYFFIMQNGIPLSDGLLPEITNDLVAITSRTRKERVKKSYFIEKTFSNKGNDI